MRTGAWRGWAGTARVRPARSVTPTSEAEVVAALADARRDGLTVRCAGHLSTPLAVTDGVLLRPEGMASLRSMDPGTRLVTVDAGMPLHRLTQVLDAHGRALPALGDSDRQTVAGATQTGTHGTGRRHAALAEQVAALRLVLADGSVVDCDAGVEPDLFQAARVGLGAIGVVTAVTLRTVPAFRVHAVETPGRLPDLLDRFAELAEADEHAALSWVPFTDAVLVRRANPTDLPVAPMGRLRAFWDGTVVESWALDASQRVQRAAPRSVRALNAAAARLIPTRDHVDVSHRVLAGPRSVPFLEMEYALPRAAAVPVLRELSRRVASGPWRIGFPVEVRVAPADTGWLSPAHSRATTYVAVRAYPRTDWEPYRQMCEELFAAAGGRPQWGTLHTRDAAALRPLYPRFDDVLAVRDRVDPQRLFANAYLSRVLGP